VGIFEAVVLGIVQGLTEFLPISSSGHLILFPKIAGWQEQPLVFDTTMHLATSLAIIIYFYKDILNILLALNVDLRNFGFRLRNYSTASRIGLAVVAGTVPAGLLGFLLGDVLEYYFREIWSVVLFLVLGSFLMLFAESRVRKEEGSISLGKGFMIGLFQSLALFSGFSRSGSTISGGMILGLNREQAARFSFLLSIPIILSAGMIQLVTNTGQLSEISFAVVTAGFLSSFLSGMLAIRFLLAVLKKYTLRAFIIYRMILALILVLLVL
jgi:undecaprenyl-diphosphatase